MRKALIETEGLSKTYVMGEEEVRALRDLTVTICEGECVAVMGPSGSGKSTFMNLVGCTDRASAGHYRLHVANPSARWTLTIWPPRATA